jgi:fibro-slime domain-containing protein
MDAEAQSNTLDAASGVFDAEGLDANLDLPDRASPPCGDGERAKSEACDDGNKRDGDGCSADCLAVEPGFSCFPQGAPCRRIARCGDGVVASSEPCDDGNTQDGDGCSARCKLELGSQCSGQPSKCEKAPCGDGKIAGAEACDDGNGTPFDGCSQTCQGEPSCATGKPCTSKCGDGLVLGEDCDDGNLRDGDGCSASCKREPGFSCETSTPCEQRDGKCVLRVPAVFHDFQDSHTDFGIPCGGLRQGIVAPNLGAQGKPVLANGQNACIASADSFAQWYTDSPDNVAIVGELVLYEDGKGGFVNRYGSKGEQWRGRAIGNEQPAFDGTPLFFPLDDAPRAFQDERLPAEIPAQYGYEEWPLEAEVIPNARMHNFLFTTQVVYWFKYLAETAATLNFSGDDDVWVFVNGKLALDLGGSHVPESGSVTIDAQTAPSFELTAGNVYEIRVFHAERKANGSSFKLTLAGFQTGRSECKPICGDGQVLLGEECDDGKNDGGYEECAPGCLLGPRCGDGLVQTGEDCDDGNRRDGDECGSSCRKLVLL